MITLHDVRSGMERFLRHPPEMNFSDLDQIDLAERWRRWRETMEFGKKCHNCGKNNHFFIYLRLNMADSDEKEQCDAFRYIIGQDGRDIYNTMTFTTSEVNKIDALFAKFDYYCTPRKNVIMERYKFNIRTQQKDETSDQYVTELKLIANNCNFGSLEDELIRDRLVYVTNSERVKERLLREEELTLLKALKICCADEQSNKQLEAMKTDEDVHAIYKPKESKVNKDQFKLNTKRKNFMKRNDKQHESTFKCKYCGKSHAPKQCPAFGKKCHNCGKNNHFFKVCQKKKVFGVEENKTSEHLEPLFIGAVNHP